MKRTTIMLPPELKNRASKRAHKLGISVGELIRWCLGAFLDRPEELSTEDPLLSDDAVYKGRIPPDLSARHDHYLYGEHE